MRRGLLLKARGPAVLLWSAAAVAAVVQAWAGLRRPPVDQLSDLQVYLGSTANLRAGGSLYDFAAAATGAPFTYPPFAGVLFAPLPAVPFGLLAVLWSVATAVVVAGVAVLAAARSQYATARRPELAGLVALALFLSAPVSSNLRFGQISVFLAALVLCDALRVVPQRFRGVATGVAAAVKLTPLIFVPYYWFSGQRRTALTTVGTFVGCTAVGWLVLPGDSARFWFTELWNVNRVGNIATGGNQSLNGALLRWDVPDGARSALAAVLGAAVVTVALVRAARAYRNDRPLAAVVIVGAAGLVFSPVSWTHHQIWLVLAALLVISDRWRRNLGWAAAVLVIMILPVTSVVADALGDPVTVNARLWLAVAVACLVPFTAVRRPRPVAVPPGSAGVAHG